MRRGVALILILVLSACQYFETEKLSSEDLYKAEIETIDWSQVDRYPIVPGCSETSDKTAQWECLGSYLSQHLGNALQELDGVSARRISDTVKLTLEFREDGKVVLLDLQLDTLIERDLPGLRKFIEKTAADLPVVEPALKRGVPVSSRVHYPVLIRIEDL